jgi:hypothetical protein
VVAALLLGAVISALAIVAQHLPFNLANGGLLLVWAVLWGLAFVALALLGETARSLSLRVTAAWQRATEHRELT